MNSNLMSTTFDLTCIYMLTFLRHYIIFNYSPGSLTVARRLQALIHSGYEILAIGSGRRRFSPYVHLIHMTGCVLHMDLPQNNTGIKLEVFFKQFAPPHSHALYFSFYARLNCY